MLHVYFSDLIRYLKIKTKKKNKYGRLLTQTSHRIIQKKMYFTPSYYR